MQKFTDTIKQIKIVDFIIIIGFIIAITVGFFTFTHVRQTADKRIEATSKIRFQVYIRSVTLTGEGIPMQKDEKAFISIRNVPYSDLKIVDIKSDKKKIVLPSFSGKKFVVVEDASQSNLYDLVITLEDTAKITKDGAVVGGNKVKIGLPITLEGDDYKLTGIVSNIQIMPDEIINNQSTTYDVQ